MDIYKIRLNNGKYFQSEITNDDLAFDTFDEAIDFINKNYNRIEFKDDYRIVKINKKAFPSITEKIIKKGSKWEVQSEKGKNLGKYNTKKEAEDRLKQVHYFKHMNESNYYQCEIYGGYNRQELLADDIEVYAKNEKEAEKKAIKIYKQDYNYYEEDNPFGLEAEIISTGEGDDLEESWTADSDYYRDLARAEGFSNVVYTVDLDGDDEKEFDDWEEAVKYAKEKSFDRIHASSFGFEGPRGYDNGDYVEYDDAYLDLNKQLIDVYAEKTSLDLTEHQIKNLAKSDLNELSETIEIRPGSTTIIQKYKEFDTRQEALDFIISEEEYGEMSIRYIPKIKKYRVVWEEIDDNKALEENRIADNEFVSNTLDNFLQDIAQMYTDISYEEISNFEKSITSADDEKITSLKKLYREAKKAEDEDELIKIASDVEKLVKGNKSQNVTEDIEKHDTLNPALWNEDKSLKPEVKEAVINIVDQFVSNLERDGVKLEVSDIVVVGSNASYNYTKDSDIDIHILADESFDCDDKHLPIIYNAYKALFNSNYNITIHGFEVELYVEDAAKMSAVSNGIYSVTQDKWLKEPVQLKIPDLDQEAFDKEFKSWEDKYLQLIDDKSLKEALVRPNMDSDKIDEDILNMYLTRRQNYMNSHMKPWIKIGVGTVIRAYRLFTDIAQARSFVKSLPGWAEAFLEGSDTMLDGKYLYYYEVGYNTLFDYDKINLDLTEGFRKGEATLSEIIFDAMKSLDNAKALSLDSVSKIIRAEEIEASDDDIKGIYDNFIHMFEGDK